MQSVRPEFSLGPDANIHPIGQYCGAVSSGTFTEFGVEDLFDLDLSYLLSG